MSEQATTAVTDLSEGSVQAPAIPTRVRDWRDFPFWLVGILAVLGWMAFLIFSQDRYKESWDFIVEGLRITIQTTVVGFAIALAIGLVTGLGRISRNVVLRNLAQFYIEFLRGIPILVLIITFTYAWAPMIADWLGMDRAPSQQARATIALALIYGAYLAEVFRAGIESIPKGQTEAGRSLGMTSAQTMRKIVLPQAIRNMTPAIGNDAIAMLKDSSLLSVVAVREITQLARLKVGTSFDARATYLVLTFLYLSMTIGLSLLLAWYRRRLGLDDRG